MLVAASDAPAAAKAAADYVCDGADDQAQIIAALASLPPGGGTVELSPGTFNIDNPIRTAASGPTRFPAGAALVGQGHATCLQTRMAGGGQDRYTVEAWGADHCRFEGFRVRGEEYLANTKGQHGIVLVNAAHCSVSDVWFEELSEEGLVIDHSSDVQVGRVFASRLGSAAVDIGGAESTRINVAQVVADTVGVVEGSAAVGLHDGGLAGQAPSHVNIGQVVATNAGRYGGLLVGSASHVTVAQVICRGGPANRNAVNVYKSSVGPAPRHIDIKQVSAAGTGADFLTSPISDCSAVIVKWGEHVSIGGVHVDRAYGHGVRLQSTKLSHIGPVLVDGLTEAGQTAMSPTGVFLDGGSTDNTVAQVSVSGYTLAGSNPTGVNVQGARNILGLVRVSLADSWCLAVSGEDCVVESAILYGAGGKPYTVAPSTRLGQVVVTA